MWFFFCQSLRIFIFELNNMFESWLRLKVNSLDMIERFYLDKKGKMIKEKKGRRQRSLPKCENNDFLLTLKII